MKNFKVKDVVLTREILTHLYTVKENIIYFMSLNRKYKNSYFWENNGNAATRRRQEERDSLEFEMAIPEIDFSIYLSFDLRISCMNVYVYRTIKIKGRDTTSRSFEKLINEIDEILVSENFPNVA